MIDNAKSVSLGQCHSAVITEKGELYMWGGNNWGQLGNGSKEDCEVPTKVMENVKCVSLGWMHSEVLTENGELYGFGDGEYIGYGTHSSSLQPVLIMENIK